MDVFSGQYTVQKIGVTKKRRGAVRTPSLLRKDLKHSAEQQRSHHANGKAGPLLCRKSFPKQNNPAEDGQQHDHPIEDGEKEDGRHGASPVSYTHLTLPTI